MGTDWDEQTLAEAHRIALRAALRTLPAALPAADDVAQRAVVALLQRDPGELSDWRPWVWRVARDAAIDRVRDRDRGDPSAPLDGVDGVDDSDTTPAPPALMWARGSSEAGMWPSVWAALTRTLSERERALLLADLDGVSFAELAEDFGYAGADSVSVALTRIRRRLRDAYATQDDVLDLLGDQRIY